MLSQEVNNVIEDSCQQAVTNLPRYVIYTFLSMSVIIVDEMYGVVKCW